MRFKTHRTVAHHSRLATCNLPRKDGQILTQLTHHCYLCSQNLKAESRSQNIWDLPWFHGISMETIPFLPFFLHGLMLSHQIPWPPAPMAGARRCLHRWVASISRPSLDPLTWHKHPPAQCSPAAAQNAEIQRFYDPTVPKNRWGRWGGNCDLAHLRLDFEWIVWCIIPRMDGEKDPHFRWSSHVCLHISTI